ncbi:PhzF family phenazine biosynthesis protein [Nocardia brevicatena]|uniref:PhzF family phenazine biosynthesis protein n=1 Tax=Nocardia brevicatena TaxID=37327 RepID=UPI002478F426|nr:PhzF family phenazine biosynthesis protein [Nocardia brevicatena]
MPGPSTAEPHETPIGSCRNAVRDRSRCAAATVAVVRCSAHAPRGDLEEQYLERIVTALGIDSDRVPTHQWVDNGPGWAVARPATAQEVLDLEPDLSQIPIAMVGAIGSYPDGSEHASEMRTFAPVIGVAEDPVCGSMNASVGQWLAQPAQYRAATASPEAAGWAGPVTSRSPTGCRCFHRRRQGSRLHTARSGSQTSSMQMYGLDVAAMVRCLEGKRTCRCWSRSHIFGSASRAAHRLEGNSVCGVFSVFAPKTGGLGASRRCSAGPVVGDDERRGRARGRSRGPVGGWIAGVVRECNVETLT